MSDDDIGRDVLTDSARRGARRVALRLLDRVATTRERLDDADDREAVHDFRVALRRLRSWLRAFRAELDDTLSKKVERRFRQLAHATGESRDLEVHIAWLAGERRSLPPSARYGATWAIGRLRRDKLAADAALHAAVESGFEQAMERARDALSRYEARVFETRCFGAVAAELVEAQSAEYRSLAGGAAHGERAEVHAARISAKRLRYLLQALEDVLPTAAVDSIAELQAVQDTLGELHDAQVFGGTLATTITELAAARAKHRARARATRVATKSVSARVRTTNPLPGLRVLSRRLHAAAERCVDRAAAQCAPDATDALVDRIAALAHALHPPPAD